MVCFQFLKHYHIKSINNAIQIGDVEFIYIEFLTHIPSI